MGHEKDQYGKNRFPGQKPGECIRLVIRKHWIIDVKIGAALFVMGFLPALIGIGAEIFVWDGHLNDTFLTFFIGFMLYFLIVLIVTYMMWLNEELDIIVATDERLVSHEQIDIFHRKISETNIHQIEDVTGTQKGFFQSLLHYGSLEIQTAASDVFLHIKHVTRPYENARALLDLRDVYIKKHNTSDHD